MITIEKFRHYFTITELNFSKLIYKLYNFNKELVTNKMVLHRAHRGAKPTVKIEVDKMLYVIETESPENSRARNLIRYPISLLDDILLYIRENIGTDISIKENDIHESLSIPIKSNLELTPRPYQKTTIESIVSWKKENILIPLQPGDGKFLPLTAKIRVPRGWVTMGDIKLNDIVIGRDGKPTTVVGVYPQGVKDLYRVTFEDGRYVDAGLEHLWTIHNKHNGAFYSNVTSTEDVIKQLDNGTTPYIDLVIPEDYIKSDDIEMSIYLLMINICTNKLNRLPSNVFNTSVINKYSLLESIIIYKGRFVDNSIVFTHSNKDMLDDLTLLVRSLGGICYNDGSQISFKLHKIFLGRKTLKENYLAVKSIVQIEAAEAQCIAVDNEDKLYVTDDYIVTHNTLIAMFSLAEIKRRFLVLVLPRYIDKWISDILYLSDIQEDEIYVIKGIKGAIDIITNPENYSEYKCFILSITTSNIFIKSYLKGDVVASMGISPEDITKNLGIDLVLNDEAHQEFFNVYRFMLYCNHRITLGLSATLEHRDRKISRMYELGFPLANRLTGIKAYDKYITVFAVSYRFRNRKQIRYKNHFGYNQNTFEKSIFRNSETMRHYADMINTVANNIYFKRRDEEDKLVIFVSTVKMCYKLSDYFKSKYREFKIGTYTEEDELSVIFGFDIIISTIQSLSVGIDIPNLISSIQTVSGDSVQMNTQSSGRLRKITDKKTIFAYLWSTDIPSHKRYHNNKLQLFNKIAKSTTLIHYRHLI